jgi:hypothetical protein
MLVERKRLNTLRSSGAQNSFETGAINIPLLRSEIDQSLVSKTTTVAMGSGAAAGN